MITFLVSRCLTSTLPVKSRAGNKKLWEFYLNSVLDGVENDRKLLDGLCAFETWSVQVVITLDGELPQIKVVISEDFIEKATKINTFFHKHPSNCSGWFQANDLMAMHKIIHKVVSKHTPEGLSATDDMKTYFKSHLADKLWPQ